MATQLLNKNGINITRYCGHRPNFNLQASRTMFQINDSEGRYICLTPVQMATLFSWFYELELGVCSELIERRLEEL